MAKMRKAVDKREDDIKKKLTAAIMMLLVSCIMVVTSTYAWFTLSTAPEVTGIQTTIGGNGNLEIALANKNTWAADEPVTLTGYDSNTPVTTINESWGNLITLDDTNYGINLLNLSPAGLALPENSNKINNNILNLPKYGVDGRISSMENAISGIYSSGSFGSNDGRGLRAFGLSVKMTERQSAFNKYLNLANGKYNTAISTISTSLTNNGGVLANIAFNLAMSSDRANVEFESDQFKSIKNLVISTYNSVSEIEQGIISTVNAYLASSLSSLTDTDYNKIKTTVESFTVTDNLSVSGDVVSVKYDGKVVDSINNAQLATIITNYTSVAERATNAKNAVEGIAEGTKVKWSEISNVVGFLMDINAIMTTEESTMILINDMTVKELKEFVGYGSEGGLNFTNAMTLLGGMTLKLNKGSGLFYDIAELAGDLNSNFSSEVIYSGNAVPIEASIVAKPTNPTPLLPSVATVLQTKAPSSEGSEEANVISDIYGYAVDLLFRTNADKSNLLLQTLATDRIYTDNDNPQTQGAGSYFEFRKFVNTFSDESMLKLMDSIRIVITDETNTILAEARLDTRDGKYVANGTTIYVPIRLVDTTKQPSDAGYYIEDGSTVKADNTKEDNKQAICELTKNEKTQISFIVFLDGEEVTNADVANAAKSMTGTMNLQFSSNAGLQAMDYSGLKVDGNESNTGTTTPDNGSGEQTQG